MTTYWLLWQLQLTPGLQTCLASTGLMKLKVYHTTVAMFMVSLLGREDRNQTGGQSVIQLTTLVPLQMVGVPPTFLENIFCNKQVK